MKRWVFRITICLVLGVVTTVGVAWVGFFWSPSFPVDVVGRLDLHADRWLTTHGDESPRADDRLRLRQITADLVAARPPVENPFGGERYYAITVAWYRNSLADRYAAHGAEAAMIDPLVAGNTIRAIRFSQESLILQRFGWPRRALERVHLSSHDDWWRVGNAFDAMRYWGAPTNRQHLREVSQWRFLPTHPVWSGFLINTLFYAAIWFGLLFAPGMARRFIRTRRGLCPQCGYDLRCEFKDGCSECGWNRGEAVGD